MPAARSLRRQPERARPRRSRGRQGNGETRILLPRGVRALRRAAGLLTRGSLPRRLPGQLPSGVVAVERLPLQRRDRPGLAPEFPHCAPICAGTLASCFVDALALDLDAVLADTRPLW